MEAIHGAQLLSMNCTGPNRACKTAHRTGRPVHMIPKMRKDPSAERALVLPTYHFATFTEGVEAIAFAEDNAPTVQTDEDLYRYRKLGVAHFLPIGWVDPSRR